MCTDPGQGLLQICIKDCIDLMPLGTLQPKQFHNNVCYVCMCVRACDCMLQLQVVFLTNYSYVSTLKYSILQLCVWTWYIHPIGRCVCSSWEVKCVLPCQLHVWAASVAQFVTHYTTTPCGAWHTWAGGRSCSRGRWGGACPPPASGETEQRRCKGPPSEPGTPEDTIVDG